MGDPLESLFCVFFSSTHGQKGICICHLFSSPCVTDPDEKEEPETGERSHSR